MASLQSQISAFKSDISSSASRVSQKRTVGPTPISRPSPAPSASSLDLKRKAAETNVPSNLNGNVVYSQPALTGTGNNLMTQVTLAVDHLRDKDIPLTFDDIFRYLSASYIDDEGRATIKKILETQHSKVEYDPAGAKGKGTFRFKPPHNVRSAEDLLALLQRQTTAQGIPVKELREGWAGAFDAINTLEAEHKVLVTRNAKDGQPKRVWPDDETLHIPVEPEFREIWQGLKPPTLQEDLRKELINFGLTPTSQVKTIKVAVDKSGKRKRKARSGGKVTNTHMSDVLKSYEHLRK